MRSAGARVIKIIGRENRGGAEGENDRGLTTSEEFFYVGRQWREGLRRFVFVVKAEAGLLRLRGPVGLGD